MMFGDTVRPADTIASTEWLDASCRGESWTVGALVPNHYESFLRLDAPAADDEDDADWWAAYRELFDVVASIGERHTASPDRAWFAIWDGHGFDASQTRLVWRSGPVDEAERRAREARQAELRDEDRRRHAAIRAELDQIPRIARPDRTYDLLQGPVSAVTTLRYPDAESWRNPDLWWPDDRRWFVATDVDFWSLYVGGPSSFVAELADSVPTGSERVGLDHQLEHED